MRKEITDWYLPRLERPVPGGDAHSGDACHRVTPVPPPDAEIELVEWIMVVHPGMFLIIGLLIIGLGSQRTRWIPSVFGGSGDDLSQYQEG